MSSEVVIVEVEVGDGRLDRQWAEQALDLVDLDPSAQLGGGIGVPPTVREVPLAATSSLSGGLDEFADAGGRIR